ncbi:MAG: acyl-CoA dehydrogenase [Bacteroidota bacterium]
MSTNPPPFSQYSPGVLSLLPLYYVGWADSLLSPAEVQLIRRKIDELPHLTAEDKTLLQTWSNPAQPPSKALFKHWVTLIKKSAKDLPGKTRQSLAELGLEMARQSLPAETTIQWDNPATRSALEAIETALNLGNWSAYRNIFHPDELTTEQAIPPAFDVAAMTKILDGDLAKQKQQMRQLLSDPAFDLQNLPIKEDYREHVLHWCHLLAERGLGALSYPKDCGGMDDMGGYVAVFESLGYHDLSLAIKFGVQFGLFGGSILWLGTQEHHQKYLKEVGTLALPGCFAMTETGHGSNVRSLQTTATYDPIFDGFVVHSPDRNAGKEYIGNALHGRMASVFAQLIVEGVNYGVHAFLVPLRQTDGTLMPGIEVEDCGYKMGLNGVDNGRIWFYQVKIPRANLLNRFGHVDEKGIYSSPIENPSKRFFTMLGTLVGGRVCVPQAGLSATKVGLSIAIRYALKRRQFAPKPGELETLLLDYPSHQRRLMPLLAKTYALDFALKYLTKRYLQSTEEDIREIETLAAGLKAYSTWFTTAALQECREACGGKGYLAENRYRDLKADTDVFTTFEGDNTVLLQLVAKGLLSSFKQAFHDEGFLAVMRLLAQQVGFSLTEYNPIATRNTDTSHLCDRQFHLTTFQYREQKMLIAVTQRMRNLLKKRMDPYDAFLRCQNQMIHLALAYVERVVLEQFTAAVDACEDRSCQMMLKKLCDLYALSTIENHRGWYLEQDYLQGVKSKAIRKMVDKLCTDIRGEAQHLVDAFAIPNNCLAAPIAL